MTSTLAIDSDSNEMRISSPDDDLPRSGLAACLANVRQFWHQTSVVLRPAAVSRWRQLGLKLLSLGLVGLLVGCTESGMKTPRHIVLKQSWELESGDRIAGHLVTGSLGDVSIRVIGAELVAPFSGQVELAAKGVGCIYFSTPEVPAYLFRYCGVRHPQLGWRQVGESMGRGRYIHFATLRRLPDGAWAIVEPSDRVLEQSLKAPSFRFRF
jgi:hypothetical protein